MKNMALSDEIAELQRERLAELWENKRQQAVDELQNIEDLTNQIRETKNTDRETAKYLVGELEEANKRYRELDRELRPPEQNQFSEQDVEFLSQYDPQDLMKPSWYTASKYGGPQITNLQAMMAALIWRWHRACNVGHQNFTPS
jgi:predicted nuclease with TOPRIM domain